MGLNIHLRSLLNITKASFYFVIYRISIYEHILMNKLLEVKKLIRVNIRVHVCFSYGKIHASNNNSWILPFSIFFKKFQRIECMRSKYYVICGTFNVNNARQLVRTVMRLVLVCQVCCISVQIFRPK